MKMVKGKGIQRSQRRRAANKDSSTREKIVMLDPIIQVKKKNTEDDFEGK